MCKTPKGDLSNNAMIAQKFALEGGDLVLVISTPSAQAAMAIKDTLVLLQLSPVRATGG